MLMNILVEKHSQGIVHCPICTHVVPADIDLRGRRPRVVPGQKCSRCRSTLDVAMIVQVPVAA